MVGVDSRRTMTSQVDQGCCRSKKEGQDIPRGFPNTTGRKGRVKRGGKRTGSGGGGGKCGHL